jgi:AbrB family looped-hinge helix DNA binding protein
MATKVGTLSTRGRVTIPRDIRRALRIHPGDKILFDLEGGNRAVVRKVEPERMNEILDHLGPTEVSGLEVLRRLRREWTRRDRRH